VADLQKRVSVIWAPSADPDHLRDRLIAVATELLDGPAQWASVVVRDARAAETASPNPFPFGVEKPSGLINTWSTTNVGQEIERALAEDGWRVCTWDADESVYKDYGDNAHAEPRDWPDGVVSPGLTAVSFLTRPPKIPLDEWIRRWHGRMSPVSEEIQPRTRYVRNLLTGTQDADPPPFAGVVEEAWPSAKHITNPFLFYGAGANPLKLLWNMGRIVGAVTSFMKITEVQTVVMSEWFLRTPGQSQPPGSA